MVAPTAEDAEAVSQTRDAGPRAAVLIAALHLTTVSALADLLWDEGGPRLALDAWLGTLARPRDRVTRSGEQWRRRPMLFSRPAGVLKSRNPTREGKTGNLRSGPGLRGEVGTTPPAVPRVGDGLACRPGSGTAYVTPLVGGDYIPPACANALWTGDYR
jgi:hypothetical protein